MNQSFAKSKARAIDPEMSGTQNIALHEACGYSFIVVRCDGKTKPPVVYRDHNAANLFLTLQNEEEEIRSELENRKETIMSDDNRASFR